MPVRLQLILALAPVQTAFIGGPGSLKWHPSPGSGCQRRSQFTALLSQPPSWEQAPVGNRDASRLRRVGVPKPSMQKPTDGFVFGEDSVERVLAALRNGEIVLLAEDGGSETSISLLASSQHLRAEQVDFLLQHGMRLQVALEPDRYRSIYKSLHKIVLDNNNLAQPALSVSLRGAGRSPLNSSHVCQTVHALLEDDPDQSLVCPGAVPLACCRQGGVLLRAGATEAAVELNKLAGLAPLGLHVMLRETGVESLREASERWGVAYSSTADLVAYKRHREVLMERCGPPAQMPTRFGNFIAHCYRSRVDGVEHIAMVKAEKGEGAKNPLRPFEASSEPALVRVHSECCTGDIFGSLRCDCGPQLEAALASIEADGWGVLLYLRGQEGRGIGLGAKIHAYSLQERGLDTMDANVELGLPVDSREYGTGAQILADLGINQMRLISNNPKKFTGLSGYGLEIVERVPSHTSPNPENIRYLRTKEERMGHTLSLDKNRRLSETERLVEEQEGIGEGRPSSGREVGGGGEGGGGEDESPTSR